jgi:hypothetical protein
MKYIGKMGSTEMFFIPALEHHAAKNYRTTEIKTQTLFIHREKIMVSGQLHSWGQSPQHHWTGGRVDP